MLNRLRKLFGIPLKTEIVIPICVFCRDSITSKKHDCFQSKIFIEKFRLALLKGNL